MHSSLATNYEKGLTRAQSSICVYIAECWTDEVKSPIVVAAKKFDRLDAPAWQVGIQFFQVGRDADARRSLEELDDDLAELAGDADMRDIVDAVPWTGLQGERLTADSILEVVLGAVNRRLDRKERGLHR